MNDIERLKLLIRAGVATERHFREAGEAAVLKAKLEGGTCIRAHADEVQVVSEESRTLRYVWSSEKVDRMGDIIRVAGWDTANFSGNPIALWGHDTDQPIGNSPQHVKDLGFGKLWGDITFAPEGASPVADSRYKLAKAGVLKATSVGFLPLEVDTVSDKTRRQQLGLGDWGVMFLRQELLEISLVSVPANPDALQLSVRQAIGAGVITEEEGDSYVRGALQTERELLRQLEGMSARRSAVPRPELPWERALQRTEELAESLARIERAVAQLGDRLSAPAGADARGSDAGRGYDAGQLLDLIDQRARRLGRNAS